VGQPHYARLRARIIHKLLAQAIGELRVRERTIVAVGCSVLAYYYLPSTASRPARPAPAVATGSKRTAGRIVVAYQGDGDLLAIGMGETVHTASGARRSR
jgi:2-oxoglutarate ferredoxin oxidoreductase subunit beta